MLSYEQWWDWVWGFWCFCAAFFQINTALKCIELSYTIVEIVTNPNILNMDVPDLEMLLIKANGVKLHAKLTLISKCFVCAFPVG